MTFKHPTPPMMQEAQLQYESGDYRVIRQGHYVRCAVTGQHIPLSELRYWSAEHQEAYAGPEQALERARQLNLLPER